MDNEESRVGLVCFRGGAQLTPLQKQMAERYDGKFTVGNALHMIRLGRLSEAALELARQQDQVNHCKNAAHLYFGHHEGNNRCPSILYELSHISFPNLTCLIVSKKR